MCDDQRLALGTPLRFHFSQRTAANRFMKAALTEKLATWDPRDRPACGVPTQPLLNLYRTWGQGGFGIIVSGNTMVDVINIGIAT